MNRSYLVRLTLAAACLAVAPAAAQEVPYSLEGFVVTATPTPRPLALSSTHVSVLDGAELRAAGHSRVVDVLRDVPGLAVVQGGSFGAATSVFLRGGESNYVLVLIDGVQVNQPGGAFDFAGLDLDNVERIEVVRGGASALYGSDAVAGVIHIITSAGRGRREGSLGLRAGNFGRLDASARAAGSWERASYSLSLSRTSTEGIHPFNSDFTNRVFSGGVTLSPDEGTRARLTLRLADRRYHYPTDGSGRAVDTNSFSFGDETTVGVELSRRLAAQHTFTVRLAHSQNDGGTDDAPDSPLDSLGFYGFTSLDHVRRSAAEVRLDSEFSDVVVSAGAELEDQDQRSFTESLSQFGPSSGRSEYDRWNRAGYLHVVGGRGRAGFNAGARVEDNEQFGTSVSWQVGASAEVVAGSRLRGAVSRAIKEPTFFENFATGFAVGNPDLRPEEATSWEIGADLDLRAVPGVLRVTWFDQTFRDLIQYTPFTASPGDPNFLNIGEADAEGVEAEVRAEIAGFGGAFGLTWLRTEVVDPGPDDGPGSEFVTGERLLRRPEHVISAQLTRRLPGGATAQVAFRRVAARDDRDFSTFPATRVLLDAYHDLQVGASAPLGPNLSILLRGQNLLDESFEEAFGFRAPGRTVQVEARVHFGGR